jgi:hypothetical protein
MEPGRSLVEWADVRFKDYVLEGVYLRASRAQRAEIIAFWTQERAVADPQEAARRSHEAVFIVRNASGELAGLSTVGFMKVPDGRTFYAYRMFLRPRDRVPYLMLAVVLATRDFLKIFRHPAVQVAGLLHVNENLKLMRPGMRRLFQRNGYSYWGKTPAGEDVWAVEFDHQATSFRKPIPWREALRRFWHCRRPGTAISCLTII